MKVAVDANYQLCEGVSPSIDSLSCPENPSDTHSKYFATQQTFSFKIVLVGDPRVGTTKLCFVIEKKPFSFEHSFLGYNEIHSKAPDGAMAGLSSFHSGILNARRRIAVFAQHRHLPCLLFHSGSKVFGECGFQRSDGSAGRQSDYGQVCE